jgi:hypothetical protein
MRRLRWHWQNLNDRGPVPGSGFWNGRAWLSIGRYTHGIEWVIGKLGFGIRFAVQPDSEHTVSAHIQVPGIALYWHVNPPFDRRRSDWLHRVTKRTDATYGTPRGTGVSIYDWSICWDVWADETEWRRSDPRWRHGSWDFRDALLGRPVYTSRPVETRPVVVPMPEYGYHGTATLTVDTWRRARWFPRHLNRVTIDVPGGVPVPGKGENAWDCDEDAIHSQTSTARTIENGIANLVASALSTRRRYGGANWRPTRRPPVTA